jgi:hypothetical protein
VEPLTPIHGETVTLNQAQLARIRAALCEGSPIDLDAHALNIVRTLAERAERLGGKVADRRRRSSRTSG